MGDGFNDDVVLPPNLIRLHIGDRFNKPVRSVSEYGETLDVLPKSLTDLSLGQRFNQPLDLKGTKIRCLQFETCFNNSVVNLPDSMERLCFGHDYNQPLPKMPSGLKRLWFLGCSFNQPVDAIATCNSLITVEFGTSFNQPIDMLSSCDGLRFMSFGSSFNQPIARLPDEIDSIRLHQGYNHPIIDSKYRMVCDMVTQDNFNQFIYK